MATQGLGLTDPTDLERYQACYRKLINFTYTDEDSTKTNLNVLLDELNAFNFSVNFVQEQSGNQLLLKLCSVIPVQQERLLVKFCQVINNFRAKQKIALRDVTVTKVTDYLVTALQRCPTWSLSDILPAFNVIINENCGKIEQFHEILLGDEGILIQLTSDLSIEEDILLYSVHSLEHLTTKTVGQPYIKDKFLQNCFKTYLRLLHQIPTITKIHGHLQCKILISVLHGLQNTLANTKSVPYDQLGPLLAGIRGYIYHGLTNQAIVIPETLYPTLLSSLGSRKVTEVETEPPPKSVDDDSSKKSGKKEKKRKGKKQDKKNDASGESGSTSKNDSLQQVQPAALSQSSSGVALQPAWANISSSESDFSDTEGGRVSKLSSVSAKVRQYALSCLHTVIKNVDKKTMFGYWSSFIPDSPNTSNSPQYQTLLTIVLKDHSPKCRMGGLASLSALIEGTKPYLAVAEDSDQMRTAFTPFSVIIGSMIKEMHRCLLLAMVAENYPLTLTQLIKCIGALIANVPYHRLRPGLLSRVVRHLRHFIHNKDPNVRVACLTCLGSMVGIEPPLMEVWHIIRTEKPPVSGHYVQKENLNKNQGEVSTSDSGIQSDQSNASSSTSNEGVTEAQARTQSHLSEGSSGIATPVLASGSGSDTPVFTEQALQIQAKETSWLMKMCVKNVVPQPISLSRNDQEDGSVRSSNEENVIQPLPVRLESMQVLANMTRVYFNFLRHSLTIIREVILTCIEDTEVVIKLHGAKLLDVLTKAMLREMTSEENKPDKMSHEQIADFWLFLLNGSVPGLLQSDHNPLRATTCDCFSNIGAEVFAKLPNAKRIMCMTMMLGLADEEDKLVKSAAARTLGVYVLYPCLREDVFFTADVANAVLLCMEDNSCHVRLKSSWSLANVCETLVANRERDNTEFINDFSDMLLLKLLKTSTKACSDNDKVKPHAVRAVGNILRYIPSRSIGKSSFQDAIEEGVKALIKNSTTGIMKVRWNACYAFGNLYLNDLLPLDEALFTSTVIDTMCSVMTECKNFKVRIHATHALLAIKKREHCGDVEHFCGIWNWLFLAFRSAEEITDFAEFRYRDNLMDQILKTMLHLMSVMEATDLPSLLSVLTSHIEHLLSSLESWFTRTMDKTNLGRMAEEASNNLLKLVESLTTDSEREAMQYLQQICYQLSLDEREAEKRPVEKSAFKQIYD